MKFEYTKNGFELVVEVKDRITLEEIEGCVNAIANVVVDESGNYYPTRFDYAFWYVILSRYTDMNIDALQIDDVLMLANDVEFTDNIENVVSEWQFNMIYDNAMELIEYKLNEHPLKKICATINEFIDEYGDSIRYAMNNEDLMKAVMDVVEAQNAPATVRKKTRKKKSSAVVDIENADSNI